MYELPGRHSDIQFYLFLEHSSVRSEKRGCVLMKKTHIKHMREHILFFWMQLSGNAAIQKVVVRRAGGLNPSSSAYVG